MPVNPLPMYAFALFETIPELENPFSSLYPSQGSQYWMGMRLTLEAPWFVVSYSAGEGEDALTETWCACSDVQLLSWIRLVPPERLLSVLCMIPNRQSKLRTWDSRPVASVWRSRHLTTGREDFLFRDFEGAHFTAWLGADSLEHYGEKTLVFQMPLSAPT